MEVVRDRKGDFTMLTLIALIATLGYSVAAVRRDGCLLVRGYSL